MRPSVMARSNSLAPMQTQLGWTSQRLLSLLSWYSKAMPLQLGKGTLQQLLLKTIGPAEFLATGDHGEFILQFPDDRAWEVLLFQGTFETGTTTMLEKLVRPTDVVLDIGANIGWFTVIITKLLNTGVCHAFEPQPAVYERLARTCARNQLGSRVILNQLALGNHKGSVELYSFRSLGSGHSSMSRLGRDDYSSATVPMVTLDAYLESRNLPEVDIVKIDVEGAEMGVLRGAQKLLAGPKPPIWIIEMNVHTAKDFGYAPEELLRCLEQFGKYQYYRIVHGWGETRPMRSISDYEHADNVICVPAARLDRIGA